MKIYFLVIFIAISLIGCQLESEKENKSIENIEKAHYKKDFLSKNILRFDLQLFFGGNERLNAQITVLTNSSKAIIKLRDSSQIIVNGKDVFYSPNYKNTNDVRFDAYTWTYFMLFPYKLSDPGTVWSNQTDATLNENKYNLQTLTFEANTGDAPDDWYKVYSDKKTNLIKAAAYIVTAGKTKEQAEEDPHAIEYNNYQFIEGIPLATTWTFWGWRKNEGLTDKLGNTALSNFTFIHKEAVNFEVPEGYIKK